MPPHPLAVAYLSTCYSNPTTSHLMAMALPYIATMDLVKYFREGFLPWSWSADADIWVIPCQINTHTHTYTHTHKRDPHQLPCNHGSYHLVITHWPHISCLLCHVIFTKVILIKMHPRYWVSIGLSYLHISLNCYYIMSSISESHGNPKTALKEKAPNKI